MESARLNKVTATASIMRSKLDELNRNVYTIDRDLIEDKGYKSTEEIFRYTPFVGITNTGLGSNLDLRGQGNKANTNVSVLINGIYSNMLDSSHGVTPLNTLSPNAIESIEILPGGGAVLYGNGTRGGVVNIITQRRFDKPYFNAGISYSDVVSSTGDSYNADAKFGTKIGDSTHISIGAAYINRGGPRIGDRTTGAQANFALLHDFTPGHTLSFDIDYFTGKIKTTPNNSFMDNATPSKADRLTKGNGELNNEQQRLDVSLGYVGQITQNSKLDIKAFYHLNKIDYVDSVTILSSYRAGMFNTTNAAADQSGSLFDDQKAGLIAKYDLTHTNGRFLVGFESVYNRGKRVMNQYITAAGSTTMNQQTIPFVYDHTIYIPFTGTKWTNSLFALEKYDFTERFSLTGGARYENAQYSIDVTNDQYGQVVMTTGQTERTQVTSNAIATTSYSKNLSNFALELTPNYKYSDTGNVYAKFEKGYFSPSPNSLLRRAGSTAPSQQATNPSRYEATNLKQEDYYTFELGLKDFWADRVVFSASLFYTLTNNEFYTIGNAHSVGGVEYGNFDATTRMGLEVFSEQYLLDDSLRLSESFTYIDASISKGAAKGYKVPYVSNYKATFGISYSFNRIFSIWNQNSFYGAQKDIIQYSNSVAQAQDTIPAYSLSDIGINAKFGDLSLSGGVRNVFDTFYYSYYNGDATDTIAGYGYLIGQGRSYFLEARYTF
ncbi:TonB-dependent receptor [Helicobacter sp. MIT 00-7814]|nr:TonB-dependent receptor [Helicobacter sp. MIT 99-10781]RDU52887.1 TonB-dependent receptor [Helicobacter sp. MIT 00-7814]